MKSLVESIMNDQEYPDMLVSLLGQLKTDVFSKGLISCKKYPGYLQEEDIFMELEPALSIDFNNAYKSIIKVAKQYPNLISVNYISSGKNALSGDVSVNGGMYSLFQLVYDPESSLHESKLTFRVSYYGLFIDSMQKFDREIKKFMK